MDLDKDVLAHMQFRPRIAPHLAEMDARNYLEAPIGLQLTEGDGDD